MSSRREPYFVLYTPFERIIVKRIVARFRALKDAAALCSVGRISARAGGPSARAAVSRFVTPSSAP